MPVRSWCLPDPTLEQDTAIAGLDEHPVVQAAYADAEAFVGWAGKAQPTEAEWEYAAKGELDEAAYA